MTVAVVRVSSPFGVGLSEGFTSKCLEDTSRGTCIFGSHHVCHWKWTLPLSECGSISGSVLKTVERSHGLEA